MDRELVTSVRVSSKSAGDQTAASNAVATQQLHSGRCSMDENGLKAAEAMLNPNLEQNLQKKSESSSKRFCLSMGSSKGFSLSIGWGQSSCGMCDGNASPYLRGLPPSSLRPGPLPAESGAAGGVSCWIPQVEPAGEEHVGIHPALSVPQQRPWEPAPLLISQRPVVHHSEGQAMLRTRPEQCPCP